MCFYTCKEGAKKKKREKVRKNWRWWVYKSTNKKRYAVCPALWCSWLVWSIMLRWWPEHHIFWTTLRSCVHGWLAFLRYCASETLRWHSGLHAGFRPREIQTVQQPTRSESSNHDIENFFNQYQHTWPDSWWHFLNVNSTVLLHATFRQCCHWISLPSCYETRILFCMLI